LENVSLCLHFLEVSWENVSLCLDFEEVSWGDPKLMKRWVLRRVRRLRVCDAGRRPRPVVVFGKEKKKTTTMGTIGLGTSSLFPPSLLSPQIPPHPLVPLLNFAKRTHSPHTHTHTLPPTTVAARHSVTDTRVSLETASVHTRKVGWRPPLSSDRESWWTKQTKKIKKIKNLPFLAIKKWQNLAPPTTSPLSCPRAPLPPRAEHTHLHQRTSLLRLQSYVLRTTGENRAVCDLCFFAFWQISLFCQKWNSDFSPALRDVRLFSLKSTPFAEGNLHIHPRPARRPHHPHARHDATMCHPPRVTRCHHASSIRGTISSLPFVQQDIFCKSGEKRRHSNTSFCFTPPLPPLTPNRGNTRVTRLRPAPTWWAPRSPWTPTTLWGCTPTRSSTALQPTPQSPTNTQASTQSRNRLPLPPLPPPLRRRCTACIPSEACPSTRRRRCAGTRPTAPIRFAPRTSRSRPERWTRSRQGLQHNILTNTSTLF
jgi:hypothetical protein